MIAPVSDFNHLFALWTATLLILVHCRKQLLRDLVTRTLSTVPRLFTICTGGLLAPGASGKIAIDGVWSNKSGAIWEMAISLVLGIAFFLQPFEPNYELSGEQGASFVNRNCAFAAFGRIERLIFQSQLEGCLQTVTAQVV